LLEKAKKNGEQPKDLNPRAEKLLKLLENLVKYIYLDSKHLKIDWKIKKIIRKNYK